MTERASEIKDVVRQRYARHATELPQTQVPPSLGIGDPVAVAKLQPGETVLDLGSGPGHDLLASARAVGASGRAIGVDFTPEMIERARLSATDEGLENVSILEGDLERLPLPCGAIDVVISNCVINLVSDKRRALIEAYRVLRPGGRIAVVDTAFETEPPSEVRTDADAWSCCVGGALVASDYEATLRDVGYEDVRLEWLEASCGVSCETGDVQARSIKVTARKPGDAASPARPAVPADREAIEVLLADSGLPANGLRIEDAIVALDESTVVGVVAVERHGSSAMLRSLAVATDDRYQGVGHRLMGAALDVARWSGMTDVHLLTEDAQGFFATYHFEPVSQKVTREAVGSSALLTDPCCTTATAMRLDFESADLPLLGRPSMKSLPTFQDGACC